MATDRQGRKPGTVMMGIGFLITVVFLLFGVAIMPNEGFPGWIVVPLGVGLLLVNFGFAFRVLHALENR